MSRRKKKTNRVALTPDEIEQVAMRRMASAQAHQRASVYCFDNPDAKPPNIDAFFFPAVSFELILLSVEQSLRLLLLLHFGDVLDRVDHNLKVLYKQVQNRSREKEGLRDNIICTMNEIGKPKEVATFCEQELLTCLNKHDSSYSDIRYFLVDREGRVNPKWNMLPREIQIVHCLALALIEINMQEIGNQGMKILGSMSRVPLAEAPEELKRMFQLQ